VSASATAPVPEGTAAGLGAVAVTGWAVHVPGRDPVAEALGTAPEPAQPAERAHELLGRKGLLAKEPATRLALCAVHRALGRPAGAPRPDGPPDPAAAVVASSNLGNVATVCRVVGAVREGGIREVSALDVPNASSNVVASSVAIWFRLGGPNLMVCSGAAAGLDAIALASLLLRAGRAERCVVVGAEPDDEVAGGLRAGIRAAAAAVVLEPAGAAPGIRLGAVRRTTRAAALLVGPSELAAGGERVIDLAREIGDTYGAQGVVQVALAAALLAAGTAGPVEVACGDDAGGWRAVTLAGGRNKEAQ
jgi:3-oxoacyl-[acyl-carrier-protein] synthase II